MYADVKKMFDSLPPENTADLLPAIRKEFIRTSKTIVVLDDDPTGTQTCYDVVVLTSWNVPILVAELKRKPSILFILTNSRSLSEPAAIFLALQIGRNLNEAVQESGRNILVISRSDSTLRGHFPAEVDAIAIALGIEKAVRILVPVFIEGGRFTIQDVHYLREPQGLVPVGETPFAHDASFGYTHSNLKEWVAEKTKGSVLARDVMSVSLDDLRIGGHQKVANKLSKCFPGQVCIVNAVSYKDLEVLVTGLLEAEKLGQKFIYRTSASFVSIRAGIAPGKFFEPEKQKMSSRNGSLIVVGSYVPKTTRQLELLLKAGSHQAIEIDVGELLSLKAPSPDAALLAEQTDYWLRDGKHVVIYTSRQLEAGKTSEESLKINNLVSSFLVGIVERLTVRPSFIIAKGGITSSDVATKGLAVEKAMILGQVIPGVPVWQIDNKSKFSDLIYVVFPGNVGDDNALVDVCLKFENKI
jgi:uncharacterized protein YgbK (DUF1537 family)